MTERPTVAVGLMSGTSMDGMTAALVRFQGPTRADLRGFVTRPYSPEERLALERAQGAATARDLALLHVAIGRAAVEAVLAVLSETGATAAELAFIAFPGHTMWHEPPLVSWQLGEPALLAEAFGTQVVSNLRARDVAAGGEGAPLVPMADVLLYGAPSRPRALLNIGGIANVTYVPRQAVDDGAFAFDTGPGMGLIDTLARTVEPALPYDRDGAVSARGTVAEKLVDELLGHEYFSRPPPKSTGRETFGPGFATALLDRCPGPDAVATAVALTAMAITRAILEWLPPVDDLLVSGGGRRHPGVWSMLQRTLADAGWPGRVRLFDEVFYDGDAKEAVAFALLGYLTVHGQPGNLPAATGARGARVLGSVTPP